MLLLSSSFNWMCFTKPLWHFKSAKLFKTDFKLRVQEVRLIVVDLVDADRVLKKANNERRSIKKTLKTLNSLLELGVAPHHIGCRVNNPSDNPAAWQVRRTTGAYSPKGQEERVMETPKGMPVPVKGMPVPVVPISADDSVEELRGRTIKQAAQIGDLKSELDVEKSRNEALEQRIKELEAAELKSNEDFTNVRAALVKEKAEAETKLKAAKAEVEGKQIKNDALKGLLAERDAEIQEKVQAGVDADKRVKALESEIAAAKAEIIRQHAQICEMLEAGDGKHIVAEISKLRKALEAERARADTESERASEAEAGKTLAEEECRETKDKLAQFKARGFCARLFNTVIGDE